MFKLLYGLKAQHKQKRLNGSKYKDTKLVPKYLLQTIQYNMSITLNHNLIPNTIEEDLYQPQKLNSNYIMGA